MTCFLLIYDWACGQAVSLDEVGPDAEERRAAAAWAHADDPSIEVRLVSARSAAEALRSVSGPSGAPSP